MSGTTVATVAVAVGASMPGRERRGRVGREQLAANLELTEEDGEGAAEEGNPARGDGEADGHHDEVGA